MSKNENKHVTDPASGKKPDCNTPSEEESKKDQDQKKKREETIISTAIDAILSFFEVW